MTAIVISRPTVEISPAAVIDKRRPAHHPLPVREHRGMRNMQSRQTKHWDLWREVRELFSLWCCVQDLTMRGRKMKLTSLCCPWVSPDHNSSLKNTFFFLYLCTFYPPHKHFSYHTWAALRGQQEIYYSHSRLLSPLGFLFFFKLYCLVSGNEESLVSWAGVRVREVLKVNAAKQQTACGNNQPVKWKHWFINITVDYQWL